MSTLWTPEGEWPVGKASSAETATRRFTQAGSSTQNPPPEQGQPDRQPDRDVSTGKAHANDPQAPGNTGPGTRPAASTGSPNNQPEDDMEQLRQELANAPADVVIANHAYGLFELAAVYLSEKPPRLPQAQLAIDALGALVNGVNGRLGDSEKPINDALSQIRIAYLQIGKAQQPDDGA
ncbi:MAG: hypothetical protein ACYDGY_03790 [Acidimicrobiales bacterium]